jgi:hypothetical protein
MNPVRRRPSPATAISLVALFVALGGTSYAAINLPRNSVGAAELKRNAVTSSKVKNGTLLKKDFKKGQLTAGPTGPKGDRGDVGPAGPATGAAGGDLSGSYPNPTIAAGAVTSAKLAPIEAVHAPTNLNSLYGSGGSGYEEIGYQRDAYGFVRLRGRVRNLAGGSLSGVMFTLPAGYRPANARTFAAIINSGTAGRIDVFDGGEVVLQGTPLPASGTTSLDGMEFRCAPSGANGCP